MSASPTDDACPKWRKSSYSTAQGQDCVELAASQTVAVRDSKNPDAATLRFTLREWRSFAERVKGHA